MSDIHTTPQNVHVNDKFSIEAKITNNLDTSIIYASPDFRLDLLHVTFDKEIKQETGLMFGQSIEQFTLGPHQSANVGSGRIHFISENEGQMNSQVVFPYEVNGKSEQITKPFSFNILTSCKGYRN